MTDSLRHQSIKMLVDLTSPDILGQVGAAVQRQVSRFETPIRFAVTKSEEGHWTCELGTMDGEHKEHRIFEFFARTHEDTESFNVVMLVPTGIGAAVGGHAGDATPAATLLSSVCDTLVTHPNVLNASDIVQIPSNALYVEGSLITQLMMGKAGLRRKRNNRVLVLIQAHQDDMFTNAAINSVNAARSSYGLNASIAEIDPRFRMISEYTPDGTAAGRIEGIEYIFDLIDSHIGEIDAIAITSVIELPRDLHEKYYDLGDDVVNPWGGVEAMLTHAISLRYSLPSAHAPMLESRWVAEADFGVVDPRMAAEVISVAFLQCVLRGLQRSPAVVPAAPRNSESTMQSSNISCLVIPDGCIGLPTLAALANGIPVISVQGNTNLMRNDLRVLPWQPMQLFCVNNYLEAAGVVAALRAGLSPWSVTRPLNSARIDRLAHVDAWMIPAMTTDPHSETGHAS